MMSVVSPASSSSSIRYRQLSASSLLSLYQKNSAGGLAEINSKVTQMFNWDSPLIGKIVGLLDA